MSALTKETPVKSCEYCGKQYVRGRVGKNKQLECVSNFMRRKFCSLSCSVSMQHSRSPETKAASRRRAQKFVGGSCEACGTSTDMTVHHVDGDAMNNDPQNLQTLCRCCHNFWHSMLKRIGKQQSRPMPRLVE